MNLSFVYLGSELTLIGTQTFYRPKRHHHATTLLPSCVASWRV